MERLENFSYFPVQKNPITIQVPLLSQSAAAFCLALGKVSTTSPTAISQWNIMNPPIQTSTYLPHGRDRPLLLLSFILDYMCEVPFGPIIPWDKD